MSEIITEGTGIVQYQLPPALADKGEMVASYDPAKQEAHIGSIVSHGRGFGRAAVGAFEAWAKDQGAKRVTGEAVQASLSFWMKMGYKYRSSRGYGLSQTPIWKYFW